MYKIVSVKFLGHMDTETSIAKLSAIVNSEMANGFKPVGGTTTFSYDSTVPNVLLQALVKEGPIVGGAKKHTRKNNRR